MTAQHDDQAPALRARLEASARREARWTVEVMVSQGGGRTITTLTSKVMDKLGVETGELEPIAGLEAAHALELAAHAMTGDLISLARQAGRSWHEIGEALDLGRHGALTNGSIAQAAYSYALSCQPRTRTHSLEWTCLACEHLVRDRGPNRDVPEREEGHSRACYRWAADLAAWRRSSGL